MDIRTLRAQCAERLADIEIPDPFDIDVLCNRVAASRGRPLHVLPLPAGSPARIPCGLWWGTEASDYIFYDPATSRAHADHIIAHELAHMLCDHFGPVDTALAQALLTNFEPDQIKLMLGRTSYNTAQEREAEVMASLLTAPVAAGPAPESTVLARLHDNLAVPMRGRRRGRAR